MKKIAKTKVIATIGPKTESETKIKKLISAGASIFRINSSHESKEVHKKRIKIIRKLSKEMDLYITILLDLQGPKIRVGILKEPIMLNDGDEVELVHAEEQVSECIPVAYEGIVNDVKQGDKLLLDDGKITLSVLSKTSEKIKAKVIHGGKLSSRKGLNIPGATSSINAVTPRDVDYIKFAVENDIDYLALSFVRNKEDLQMTKKYIEEFGGDIPVIAKIEKPQALENLDEIIEASDGVMVARGDLGIEISPEKVPIAQKEIIEKVNYVKKPVIVATQMLESMIEQPIPTRAEASDVANAIIDGTDAVMLSGETAVGDFPVEAVKMMQQIAENVEKSTMYKRKARNIEFPTDKSHTEALSKAIIQLITDTEIEAIVEFTKTGRSAIKLSKQKPVVPIIAISNSKKVCRRLNLRWGVFPLYMDYKDILTKRSVKYCDELLMKKTFLKEDARVIITGALPFLGFESTNFLRLQQIGFEEE